MNVQVMSKILKSCVLAREAYEDDSGAVVHTSEPMILGGDTVVVELVLAARVRLPREVVEDVTDPLLGGGK